MKQTTFLKVAIKAVKNAEKVLLKYYHGNQQMKLKSDQTPVTIADKKAEQVIMETIKKAFPKHGFLGEEFGIQKNKSEYVWIIDPIDGTKNYTRHVPLFGTLLALAKNEKIILGVSNVPLMRELMHAEKGKGAFLNGKKVRVSDTQNLNEAYMSFGSIKYFEKNKFSGSIISISMKLRSFRIIGDLWPYHLVAQGKIDGVVESRVRIWDIAPASIIIKEAGGKVTDIFGKEINLSSASIIAANKILHKKVLSYFVKRRQ